MSRSSWKKPGRSGAALYAVAAGLLSALTVAVCRLEIERARGRNTLVRELPTGPLIVVANHTSYVDGVLLAIAGRRLGRPLRLLGTAGIIDAPVIGRLFRALGFIAVARKGPNPADALGPAAAALRAGEAIALYPEGRVTRHVRFWPERAKTGAVRLSLDTGAPILPIGSAGAHRVVGRRRRLLGLITNLVRRPKVEMEMGELFEPRTWLGLEPSQGATQEQVRAASDEMMRRLVALVEGLRDERAPDPIGVERAE